METQAKPQMGVLAECSLMWGLTAGLIGAIDCRNWLSFGVVLGGLIAMNLLHYQVVRRAHEVQQSP